MNCPPLKVTFLGTGTSSGVPMIACDCEVCRSEDSKDKRFRSSVLIESETTTLVVDTTPDFRSQMLRTGVKKLDGVLVTHHHKDHIAGLDDVKAFCYFQQQEMKVFATPITQQALHREFSYIFDKNKYPGVPDVNLITISDQPFAVGDIPVVPILVWHLRMPVLGFRFGRFTYITDANRIDPDEMAKAKDSEVLVLNALRHQKHISHFNLEEAIHMADLLGAKTAYFTHISHQLGRHQAVSKELPTNRFLAYDGLTLFFPA